MAQMITDAVRQAGLNFLDSLALYLPRLITTVVIILVGWLIAILLRTVARAILKGVRFNAAAERIGIAQVLSMANMPTADVVAGSIVFWIVFVGFLLSAVDVLGFSALQGLIAEFSTFVPRLLVALVILVVGFMAANVAWRATLLAAVNARLPSPRLLGGAVRWLLLILTGAMALDQIAVARTIVLTAFAIAFGALMLGLAIAFGIGGGDVAKRILEHQFREREHENTDEVSHL